MPRAGGGTCSRVTRSAEAAGSSPARTSPSRRPTCRFAFSEVKLGIIPAVISPFALAKIGASAARRYFVTGERFDAATALRIGLDPRGRRGSRRRRRRIVVAELRTAGPRGRAACEEARARTAGRARHRAAHRPAQDGRRGPGGPAGIPREARPLVGIQKLLVANRGEIALRVFRACRRARDRDGGGGARGRSLRSSTRAAAGEAVEISSYLDPDEHLRAARETGADAIHPGYGFLAENAGVRGGGRGGGADVGRPFSGRAARRRGQARGEADRARRPACLSCPRASPTRSDSRC